VERERIAADPLYEILEVSIEIATAPASSLFQADLLEQVCHEALEFGTRVKLGGRTLHQDHHEQGWLDPAGGPRLQQGLPDGISQLSGRCLSVHRTAFVDDEQGLGPVPVAAGRQQKQNAHSS
jgi:hypothetical protein